MSERFTPGPWSVLPNTGPFAGAVVAPAGDAELGNWMIAERVRWPADARLIAAAPALYEALTGAPILSMYHGQRGLDIDRFIADYETWRRQCRAVLPAARGEQP